MSGCRGCESLPQALPSQGTLYLWPPLSHTETKLSRFFAAHNVPCTTIGNSLAVPFSSQVAELLRDSIPHDLGLGERNDCKVLLRSSDAPPSLADFADVQSLSSLIGRIDGQWLLELLTQRRLITHFQPIVYCDRPDEVFAHECLVRGLDADGGVIPPLRLYDAARGSGMLFHLDRASRLQHIRASRRLGLSGCIFINFNPTAIYDPDYCLQSTAMAIGNTMIDPQRFVFEVVESDRVEDIGRLPKILDFYREAGYRVALDDLGAGFSSLNLLSELKPDFLKIDMGLIRNVDRDPYKANIVAKILDLGQSLGVQTVVEGVETEGEWQWSLKHGADYVQGFLFGRPQATPHASCLPQEAVPALEAEPALADCPL